MYAEDFYKEQLETDYALPVKKIPWLKYFFQISMPALLLNFKATAQQFIKKNTAQTEQVEKKRSTTISSGTIEVNGCITDFSGAPVAFATVMIVGTNKGTATDIDGQFTLKLSAREKQLEISAIGFEKKILTITDQRANVQLDVLTNEAVVLSAVTLQSSLRSVTLGGAMSSVSVRSIWKKKQIAEKKSVPAGNIELFPNPVKETVHS